MQLRTLTIILCLFLLSSHTHPEAQSTPLPVDVTIDFSQPSSPISPYIYGTNQDLPGFTGWTVRRLGGNRLTGYNWENNASNAGRDWKHTSDNFLCGEFELSNLDCAKPGAVLSRFHERSLEIGAKSLITLPMAGYVAADKKGAVSEAEVAPSARWDEIRFAKGAPFAETPDLADGVVYVDEAVNFLKTKYGAADTNGVWAFSLDNEPALWSETHPRLHPAKLTAAELVNRSTELAQTVKAVDPQAQTFGPALYGFWAYMTLQDAPDWEALKASGKYSWFIDYYLEKMQAAESASGMRLLDVLDVHWYSEAQGDNTRVVFNGIGTEGVQQARIQAPRTLWDANYKEKSWILEAGPQKLPIIPNLQQSIDKFYPGTNLAFSEWGFGGESHISGGLAAADVLGIFGRHGVYAANHWSTEQKSDYLVAAFKLYRDYNGEGGTFGDFALSLTHSDIKNISVYAALGGEKGGELHIILLNKNFTERLKVNIALEAGNTIYNASESWGFDASSPNLRHLNLPITLQDEGFTVEIPPLTAAHLTLRGQPRSNDLPRFFITGAAMIILVVAIAWFTRKIRRQA